jgi:bacterioferritin-associated ferredoxin
VYVCVCNGITEHQVLEAIQQGAASLPELRAQLGVASGCGLCAAFTTALLSQAQQLDSSEQYSQAA